MKPSYRIRNRSPHRQVVMILLAVACAHSLGCGNQHGLVPVEGVVQLEGVPLTAGKVLLTPHGKGKPAAGPIQSNGSFVLSSYRMNDGARPGKHRIMILADAPAPQDRARQDRAEKQSEQPRGRYAWMAPKGFAIEIEADKENQLKIDVSPAAGWKKIAND